MSLLCDKYSPKTTKEVVGADYAAMGVISWLRSWHTPQRSFRAAMLSGPPGIGKSVLARLACAEAGLNNVMTLDSSRKRTKKALSEVEEAFSSRKIDAYLTGRMQKSKPGAIIVDDLDAMVTGGADRGGVPQVLAFIKISKIPVICVCNDANHRSLKTLVGQCMHIRMQRPPLEQIAQRLLGISRAEDLKQVTLSITRDIARGSGCDVRQSINELQLMSRGDVSAPSTKSEDTGITMDRAFNPFDSVTALFGCHPKDCVRLALRVYEADAMLGPLLIHENYPKASRLDVEGMAEVAAAISDGDMMEYAGRHGPVMADAKALMECAVPCMLVGARIEGRLDFPGHLGKISTMNKNRRLVSDVARRASYPRQRFASEIMPFLYELTVKPLAVQAQAQAQNPPPSGAKFVSKAPVPKTRAKKGKDTAHTSTSTVAVPSLAKCVADRLSSMKLTRDDWDTVFELGRVQTGSRLLVPAVSKAALTREMNKLGTGRACANASTGAKPLPNKQKRKGAIAPGSPPPIKRARLSSDEDDSDKEKEKEEEEEEEKYRDY